MGILSLVTEQQKHRCEIESCDSHESTNMNPLTPKSLLSALGGLCGDLPFSVPQIAPRSDATRCATPSARKLASRNDPP